jgi:predicted TIM-barrel fold metal-dependent hydrolase
VSSYEVVSASSHLNAPPEAWRDYVDDAFRDSVPVSVARSGGSPGWRWADAREVPSPEATAPPSGDGALRLKQMDNDGIDAEVLFPVAVGARSLTEGQDPDTQVALVRGYNDWLSQDYTSTAPERLLGVALLPATRVQDAVDELMRVSSMPGIRAVLLEQWPNGSGTPSPADDRFWEEITRLGFPLCAWQTFGGGVAAAPRPPDVPEPMPTALSLSSGSCVTQTQLITGGVLDRFPSLQILFAGLGAGWVPNQIEQADDMFRRHRYWGGFAEHHTQANYFSKHCKWTFSRDRFAVRRRELIGVENLLWSSNFPLIDNDWPNSRKALDEQLADVSEEDVRAIRGGNATSFFGLT